IPLTEVYVICAADALPAAASATSAETSSTANPLRRDGDPLPLRRNVALVESPGLMPPRPTQPEATLKAKRTISADRSTGILAVPLSWSLALVRPVTLRRHLSVVLPLS